MRCCQVSSELNGSVSKFIQSYPYLYLAGDHNITIISTVTQPHQLAKLILFDAHERVIEQTISHLAPCVPSQGYPHSGNKIEPKSYNLLIISLKVLSVSTSKSAYLNLTLVSLIDYQ